MAKIDKVEAELKASPRKWLVTGVAGFIGSNLLEELLKLGQIVVGLDNLSTGYLKNLEDVHQEVGDEKWASFTFFQSDTRNLIDCCKACEGIDYVLHQAALGSVPRSISDPISTNQSNLDGTLNMLVAARDSGVKRFVFASSSSVYGDHPELPKVEDKIGKPLSPYAVTKYVNEIYAEVFERTYGLNTIGLRYFNVFGKRQDPNGAYAAVIPKWVGLFLQGKQPTINGDGTTSRDFTYIQNVIQANLLAATTQNVTITNKVFNVAFGGKITLKELCKIIKDSIAPHNPAVCSIDPIYGPSRMGDIPHSLANINKAKQLLGYKPVFDVKHGLEESITWYLKYFSSNRIL
jgi:UDP-N-acetylglucosamine/UDP-N-acetylgalactosamine 4-epimerase